MMKTVSSLLLAASCLSSCTGRDHERQPPPQEASTETESDIKALTPRPADHVDPAFYIAGQVSRPVMNT